MVCFDVLLDVVFIVMLSLFNFDGKVDVFWVWIVVNEVLESVVGVFFDEVMLDKNFKLIKQQSVSILINSNLIIYVGNNVCLEVFGLKVCLIGDLKVVQDKQGLGFNGQINILDGCFYVYGQDLIVCKGELLFFGLLDQLLLNIEVICNLDVIEDDVIVGVCVIGFVDQLKVEIFFDLVMFQQEVLFYLLCGQGLSSGQSDSVVMILMFIGMGVV